MSVKGNESQNTYLMKTGKQLAASALSSWCEASITYPTEYTKVMLQLQKGRSAGASTIISETLRQYGPLGMYRGFSVVLVGNVPKYMCRFGAYEQIKMLFVDTNGQLTPLKKLFCGMGAGVVEALFAVIPTESVKVKFINDRCSERPKYRGLLHGVREIVRERGLGGVYTGVMPTLLKQGSNQAIRFFVFESLKEWNDGRNGGRGKESKALVPVFGALAGAASVLGNTPLDVVKTRMQGLQAHMYRSTWHCTSEIFRREGFLAFYKGLQPRLVKVVLEASIAFTMYNTFLDLFGANK